MAEVTLYVDGTTEATDADIIKARSKLYKNAFVSNVINDGSHVRLRAIKESTAAAGNFSFAAADDGQDGEFLVTFNHPNATDARAKEMLKCMVQLCRQCEGRITGAQKKTLYITTAKATKWADLMEETLAFNT